MFTRQFAKTFWRQFLPGVGCSSPERAGAGGGWGGGGGGEISSINNHNTFFFYLSEAGEPLESLFICFYENVRAHFVEQMKWTHSILHYSMDCVLWFFFFFFKNPCNLYIFLFLIYLFIYRQHWRQDARHRVDSAQQLWTAPGKG